MLIITSPAKTQNFSEEWKATTVTKPEFSDLTDQLASILVQYSEKELSQKLKISSKLAQLNHSRLSEWESSKTSRQKPAILAYEGDVYRGLDVTSLNEKNKDYLQQHLRILTGMYGVLRPFDLIQPYRLEMKTKLGEEAVDSLYEYWESEVTKALNTTVKQANYSLCLNLASQEYSKVVDIDALACRMVDVRFTQMRDGKVKSIGIYNKKARGLLIRFAAMTNAGTLDDISKFNLEGYSLVSQTESQLEFLRK